MSWQFVFNASQSFLCNPSFDIALENALRGGYVFMTWNGQVWFIGGDKPVKTSISVDQLY